MSSIKQLSINYTPVNSSNTFTNGDVINGQVVLEVSKEVTIESLYIKCKGDAKVSWSERRNDKHYHYSAYERYFKLKQYFIQDPSKKKSEDPGVILMGGEIYSNVVKAGNHVYPFQFQLPHGNFPPSFEGCHGSVRYLLEVTVDRSWKMDRTEKKEIIFMPRISGVNLWSPQSGSVDKKMKLFTSGSTSVKATIDKMGYMPGEVIQVTSDIDNSSSRDLKLKYSLEQAQSFFAQGHSKYSHKTIFKIVGDPIPSGSKQIVNTNLTLPDNLNLSITNCNIMKVDYIFKVYLDVPYASDPEIKMPIIILPLGQIFPQGQTQSDFPPYGNPGASGWNQPPPQAGFGPSPPGTNFGPSPPGTNFGPSPPGTNFAPAPGSYPSPYPSPMNPNPQAPPPSYTELYPNPNAAAPQLNPGPSAPPFNPQYAPMGYPNPSAPQQNPVPSAPQFGPGPPIPGYVPAGAPPGFWPNPNTQPESYPTKLPEKHES